MAYMFYKRVHAPTRVSRDGFPYFDGDRFQEDAQKRLRLAAWEQYEQVCEQLGIDTTRPDMLG